MKTLWSEFREDTHFLIPMYVVIVAALWALAWVIR